MAGPPLVSEAANVTVSGRHWHWPSGSPRERQVARRVVAVVFVGQRIDDQTEPRQQLSLVGADVDAAAEDPHQRRATLVELRHGADAGNCGWIAGVEQGCPPPARVSVVPPLSASGPISGLITPVTGPPIKLPFASAGPRRISVKPVPALLPIRLNRGSTTASTSRVRSGPTGAELVATMV